MPTEDAELANTVLLGVNIGELANRHKTEGSFALLSEIEMRLKAVGFEHPEVWVDYMLKRVLSHDQYIKLVSV